MYFISILSFRSQKMVIKFTIDVFGNRGIVHGIIYLLTILSIVFLWAVLVFWLILIYFYNSALWMPSLYWITSSLLWSTHFYFRSEHSIAILFKLKTPSLTSFNWSVGVYIFTIFGLYTLGGILINKKLLRIIVWPLLVKSKLYKAKNDADPVIQCVVWLRCEWRYLPYAYLR